jgi:hypothetical protein
MEFRTTNQFSGFRFDQECMFPANSAAQEVAACFHSGVFHEAVHQISWSPETAVVISNWRAWSLRSKKNELSKEYTWSRNDYLGT